MPIINLFDYKCKKGVAAALKQRKYRRDLVRSDRLVYGHDAIGGDKQPAGLGRNSDVGLVGAQAEEHRVTGNCTVNSAYNIKELPCLLSP